jgi:phosphoglycolate phosphatase-like HAD superfamily hydrolase
MFLFIFTLVASLVTTEDLATIEALPVDSETLVVFDIDLVLTESAHPHFKHSAIKQHSKLVREVFSHLTGEEQARFLAYVATQESTELVEGSAPDTVASVHDRGGRAIVCTAMLAEGEAGRLRCDDLASHGFVFTDPGEVTLDHLTFAGVPCLLSEGLLFANSLPKGEVLHALLSRLDWRPTRVIMVDDKLENLTSVQEWFDDIDVIGVHYLRARNAEGAPIDLTAFEATWRALAARVAHPTALAEAN